MRLALKTLSYGTLHIGVATAVALRADRQPHCGARHRPDRAARADRRLRHPRTLVGGRPETDADNDPGSNRRRLTNTIYDPQSKGEPK